MSRKAAARLWHKARAWDRDSHRPGRHGGLLTHVDLKIYYVLAFDFLNYATGRLDPSLDAIAAKASCCRRSVVNSLRRLAERGLIAWRRRCAEGRDLEGRYCLKQRTNAYALLPVSQWVGYRDTDPPPPSPDTLGAPEPVPDPISAAVTETLHGQQKAALAALESDPGNTLAQTLASFGRAIEARETAEIPGVHQVPRNSAPCLESTSEAAPQPPADDLEAQKRYWNAQLLGTDKPG